MKAKSKTQKKIDQNIRNALTSVCENFLKDIDGFKWISHQVDFTNFPASLLVTVVFETTAQAEALEFLIIAKKIQSSLLKVGVKFKDPERQVLLDSEEICALENNGDWEVRLRARKGRAIPRNRPDHA